MSETAAAGVPKHVIPESSRICPGSIYTARTGTGQFAGKCLCGQEREWHVWAHDGRGGFVRVTT